MKTAFGASSEQKTAKVIAVCNLKGGIGKTTTSISLSAGLAAKGKKVLLIDMDPQGNSSLGLGFVRDMDELPTIGTYMQADIEDVDIDPEMLIQHHSESVSLPSGKTRAVTVKDVLVKKSEFIKVTDGLENETARYHRSDREFSELLNKADGVHIIYDEAANVTVSFSEGNNRNFSYGSMKAFEEAVQNGEIPKKGDIVRTIPVPEYRDISFDVIVANSDMSSVGMLLLIETGSDRLLARYIDQIKDRYDYIILDCPRAEDQFTINAITAADEMLIPVTLELYAVEGLQNLFTSYKKVKRRTNPKLGVAGILMTKVVAGSDQKEYEKKIRENFEGKIHVFEQKIPELKSIRVCPFSGESVYAMHNAYMDPGAMAYYRFVEEFIEREEGEA